MMQHTSSVAGTMNPVVSALNAATLTLKCLVSSSSFHRDYIVLMAGRQEGRQASKHIVLGCVFSDWDKIAMQGGCCAAWLVHWRLHRQLPLDLRRPQEVAKGSVICSELHGCRHSCRSVFLYQKKKMQGCRAAEIAR